MRATICCCFLPWVTERFLVKHISHSMILFKKSSFKKYFKFIFLAYIATFSNLLLAVEDGSIVADLGIEGIRSQEFSVAIFYFLVLAIFIFLVFIFMFMLKSKASKLKTGEKWLFAWLLLGVVAAIVFGATQMLHGYLF